MLSIPLCGEAGDEGCPYEGQSKVLVNGLTMLIQMVETLDSTVFNHCLEATRRRAVGLKADDPRLPEIRYSAELLEGLLAFRQRAIEANEQAAVGNA